MHTSRGSYKHKQTNTNKGNDVFLHEDTHRDIQSWLPELWCVQFCEWQDWFLATKFINIFLLFPKPQSTFFFTPYKFFNTWKHTCVRVCTPHIPVNACHSVLLQGREGEACLFQGTPPELMFHTCAQCSTLYQASQVHCINCGRNHFIVGVLHLLLFAGMLSITQYSHLNCF